MEILNEFGVNWKLLIAQMINFAILLFVLKILLYKPILKMLEDRKNRIIEAEENAASIEKRLEKIEKEREKTISKASDEATKLLEEATISSAEIIAEAQEKAANEMAVVITKAKDQIAQDREKMRAEIRSELADLVTTAMTTIYEKKLTKADQEEIIKNTLKSSK